MAINCFKIGQIDPFKSSNRVYLNETSHSNENYGVMRMETLTKTAVERAQEKVNKSTLISVESIGKLNAMIEKANESETAVILDNVDHAIAQAKAIEGLADILNTDEMALAWKQLGERYADFILNTDEIRELARLRDEAEVRMNLMEAHMIKDINKLKQFALLFVRDSNGKPISALDMTLESGKTFKIDFKDPKTGEINTFAQKYLTLGMVLDAVNLLHVKVKKSNGVETDAFLWADGNTYDKVPGSTSKKYVEILQDYSFTTPETTESAVEAATDALTEILEEENLLGAEVGTAPTEEPEISLNSLIGRTAEVPDFLAKENSYDVIKQIKNAVDGRKIYGAIRMMAAIHREVQGPIDNRNMWKALHGGIFSEEGKNVVSFKEIAKAVYGKHENKLEENFEYFTEFKKAADVLLSKLSSATEGDDPTAAYETTREAVEYTGDKAKMATTSDHFFERNSYGPPISVGAFKAIGYALSPKDRPIIDEDCWMTPAARTKAVKGYKNYGETEIISHARAFDKLMNSDTLDAYLAKLNNALVLGTAHIAAERSNLGSKREEKMPAFTVPQITEEQIKDSNFKPTEDQIMAVRHGMMIEAAAELAVYQKVEDNAPSPLGEGLTEEETAEVLAAAGQKIHGVLATYIAAHDFNNLGELSSYNAALAAGAAIDIGRGFQLEFLVSGNTFAPVIRGSAGLTYEVAFGNNKKWTFDAYAKVAHGFTNPKGFLGPVVGVGLSYELGEHGTYALDAGLHASVGSAGASAGIERNVGNVLKKRIEEFDEKHSVEITKLKNEAYAAINGLNVLDVQKTQLKAAYDAYFETQIAANVTEDFVNGDDDESRMYHYNSGIDLGKVQFTGAGILGAVGLKEGGAAVGPYITLGFGFKAVTLYVPPLETPEDVSASMRAGLPLDASEYTLPELHWVEVQITDDVLWSGDVANETAAKIEAERARTSAFEAISKGVEANALLTAGDKYTNLEIKDLDGRVQLYVDSACGIEAIQDGPQGLALNLDRNDNLLIRVFEIPAAQGRNSLTVVGITNDANATLNDIMNRSGNVLEWTQTKNGGKTNSTLIDNPNSTAEAAIFTAIEMDAKIASGTKTLGDLSKEGTVAKIREVKITELEARTGVKKEAKLFQELPEADKALAKSVAEQLVKKLNYDALATSNRNDEINAKIVELYQDAFVAAGTTDKIVTVDHIYYARQYAMELGRPSHKKVPLEWNAKAFESVVPQLSKIATEYFEKNKAEILNGSLKGEFPAGTEFFIYINENGEMKVLQGYYDIKVHREMLAPIEWNAKNPDDTLTALNLGSTDENKTAVKGIADAIAALEWPKTELNTAKSASFSEVMNTMAGALLLSEADALYGANDAAILRKMVMGTGNTASYNPTLAQEFADDVYELLTNENGMGMVRGNAVLLEWETRSGLYNKCFNLVLGRNPVLKFTPPTKTPVKSGSTRDRVEQGAVPTQGIAFTQVRITPSPIPISPSPELVLPGEDGSGYEGNSANPGDAESGDGAASGGNHPSVGRARRNK